MLVGVFVLCMCGMLLLLYFFFSYLGMYRWKTSFQKIPFGHSILQADNSYLIAPPFVLVYVIIGLFALASTTAVYQCLEPIVRRIPIGAAK